MFESFQSSPSHDAFRARFRPTPAVTLTRLPEDADATGAPVAFPVPEAFPDPMPQADGCP